MLGGGIRAHYARAWDAALSIVEALLQVAPFPLYGAVAPHGRTLVCCGLIALLLLQNEQVLTSSSAA